jgi:hypothetical protein
VNGGTYVVDIAVVAIAAQGNRVARVVKAEEVQTTLAGLVARSDTHRDAVLKLLVNDNVVSAAKRHGRVVMARQVLGIVKLDRGFLGLDAQKLQSWSVSFPSANGAEFKVPWSCQRSGYHCLQARYQ